jgi:hypothetical protein
MSSWHSPQSIYALGHKAVRELLNHPVQVQEKVDGSFFAFGYYPDEYPDEPIKIRSKGAVMNVDAPMAMFKLGAETVKALLPKLHPGWQYRGEFLAKPKHNTLVYERAPKMNVILFDILTEDEEYLEYPSLAAEADRLGLEVVPQLYEGMVTSAEQLRQYLDRTSLLGGQQLEGVVVKPIVPLFSIDKKLLMGKFVSERFKEAHRLSWGESNPTSGDIIAKLQEAYRTPARWMKAVQHLREAGTITDSPRDIGPLLQEVQKDVGMECKEEIMKALWKWAWPHVSRGLTRGFPEWYKEQLLALAFEKGVETVPEIVLQCSVDGCENPRYADKQRCVEHLPGTAIQAVQDEVVQL